MLLTKLFLGTRQKVTFECLIHFVVAQRASLGGCVKEQVSFQKAIASLLQDVGCVAEVVNLSSGMTFLSSNPVPPSSSWAHYLAALSLVFSSIK